MHKRWLVLALLGCGAAWAQVMPAGPQVTTFLSDVDDSDQPYALYLPKNFDAAKKYPLVISLHGAWSNHRVNMRRVFGKGNKPGEGDAQATRYFPEFRDVNYIVASPYARGTMGYQGIAERDVFAVLADVKRRFPIDEDRVYLTGLSMGGGGTLWIGLTHPDLFAAIAPVCAAAPPGTEDLAPNALNVPVHLFHGDQDDAVPVDSSRKWKQRFLDLGSSVEYIEYPGVKHNSWDLAYKDGAIFDWFAKFKRNRYPERVRYATRAYKYTSAYWVQIDGLTPGTLASIDAKFTAKNQLEVTTSNLDGFTLKLAGHPQFASGKQVEVTVDGTALRATASDSVSFSKAGGSWKAAKFELAGNEKHAGAEGPIADAVSARHVYVFGTKGAEDPKEMQRRMDEAVRGAEWSTPFLKLSLALHAAPDSGVEPFELAESNLVLFGTKETNKLIERFADKLPLELKGDAAEYGLVFVAPVDGHYVVVNSGLPFWTGSGKVNRRGLSFIATTPNLFNGFGDFILFKGSLENVIAEGRFDRNWKVPAEQAEKIRATGVVTIR